MNAGLRAFVRERAGRRCEYCRLHEDDADLLAFHVEHVVARQHGGTDDPDFLCFACAECNWAKGPNLSGLFGGKLYPLFNPRKQSWKRHFRWENTLLVGTTFSVPGKWDIVHFGLDGHLTCDVRLSCPRRSPSYGG
jgi:HNH endonuclease